MLSSKEAGNLDRESDPVDDGLMQCAESQDLADFEAVFKRIGGGTGRYNLLVLAAMIFCNAFPGMITLSANFTASDVPFNCTEYEYTNESMLSCTVIPDIASHSQCSLNYNCSTFTSAVKGLERPGDPQRAVGCRAFYFSGGSFQETAVSRFGLVCSRAWMSTLATTFYFVGFVVGCTLFGVLADRFGRLRVAAAALVYMSVCTVGASQAPRLWLYWSLQLLTGAGVGGFMSSTYSFALENTDPKHRLSWGFNLHNGWTAGILLGTLIAYLERHYQRILLYYGLSTVAILPVLALLSESPRWLVASRRFGRADAVLNRIARINGRPLGQGFSSEAVAARSHQSSDITDASALDLLRRPGLRRVTCIVWAMFFNVSLAYYGISLGIGDLGGSILFNQLIAAAVEIPARMLGILASYRIGRRLSIMLAFGLAGCCLLVSAFLFGDSRLTSFRIATALTGKFWITMAFDLVWLYAAEVFPTVVRSRGVGIGSTFARVGAMVSTLVPALGFAWRPLPFLVFALGPVCVVLLAFAAPETKGHRLPESLDDGERLASWARGRKQDGNYIDNDTEL